MPSSLDPGAPAGAFAVCRDGEAVPPALAGAIVAVGNLDGVHLGHQALLAATKDEARRRGRPSAALTFEPHPRNFFLPHAPMFRLTPEPTKLRVLARLGLDGAFVRRFDAALAATSAAGFVDVILAEGARAAGVVVGPDFRFGHGREGTPELLRALCEARGLSCTVLPKVERSGVPVSSSAIRASLEHGDIASANAFLGYRWFVEGEVRHGDKRGRTLGYPTANLRLGDDCRLRHGIYAVRIALGPGEVRGGVASFGRRPTFDDGAPLLEVFVFDYSGDLYGRLVQVEFLAFIRGEERFDSAEALVRRMDLDAEEARRLLAAAAQDGARSMIG